MYLWQVGIEHLNVADTLSEMVRDNTKLIMQVMTLQKVTTPGVTTLPGVTTRGLRPSRG